jgi:hypothetical protein
MVDMTDREMMDKAMAQMDWAYAELRAKVAEYKVSNIVYIQEMNGAKQLLIDCVDAAKDLSAMMRNQGGLES